MYQNEVGTYLDCMNLRIRQGLALLLVAALIRALGGESAGGVAGVLAIVGVITCVIGLVATPDRSDG